MSATREQGKTQPRTASRRARLFAVRWRVMNPRAANSCGMDGRALVADFELHRAVAMVGFRHLGDRFAAFDVGSFLLQGFAYLPFTRAMVL
ncbi:hypothetical protein [Paraburkholderia caribensis]|uniref:hypothetical protein n=1 Tax=Paraburkholderia caribensis TaxID=75105 RepID=UPI001D06B42F|nr:hypothetical protein [Paraburkholderia caribensis]